MTTSDFLPTIYKKAKAIVPTVYLPDAEDERTLRAAIKADSLTIALPVLVGNAKIINDIARKAGIDISPLMIVDPMDKFPETLEFIEKTYEEKKKTLSRADALAQADDPLTFSAVEVARGEASTFVAGNISTTSDVLRAAIRYIGMEEGISSVSSFFMMMTDLGLFAFADCGVIPVPTAEQLSEIAILTAKNFSLLTGIEANVALLSFSTLGSAEHEPLKKIRTAKELVHKRDPSLAIDGELQLDAAIVPAIANRKAPKSMVAGKANVLIFPDLASGNIGYKLVEQFGKARAFGPILQGMRIPVSDLSRGASFEDIIDVIAITAARLAP